MEILKYKKIAAEFRPWSEAYLVVAKQLQDYISTEDFSVDHIGSTSFRVGGKGIIDLSLLYPEGALEDAVRHVLALGFQDQISDKPFPPERPRKDGAVTLDGVTYYIHLHIIEAGSDAHRKHTRYKEYMLGNPEARAEYEAAKKAILQQGVTEQEAYGKLKSPFVKARLKGLAVNA